MTCCYQCLDYRRNKDLFNFVPDGVKRTQKQCANIEIIPDIEFEGTKSFELFFDLIPTPRINVGPNARVVIIDYNGEHILVLCQGILLFKSIFSDSPTAARECLQWLGEPH